MPELPDLTAYLEALQQRIVGHRLERLLIVSPFLLRTAVPPVQAAEQRLPQVRQGRLLVGARAAQVRQPGLVVPVHDGRHRSSRPVAVRAESPSRDH